MELLMQVDTRGQADGGDLRVTYAFVSRPLATPIDSYSHFSPDDTCHSGILPTRKDGAPRSRFAGALISIAT